MIVFVVHYRNVRGGEGKSAKATKAEALVEANRLENNKQRLGITDVWIEEDDSKHYGDLHLTDKTLHKAMMVGVAKAKREKAVGDTQDVASGTTLGTSWKIKLKYGGTRQAVYYASLVYPDGSSELKGPFASMTSAQKKIEAACAKHAVS